MTKLSRQEARKILPPADDQRPLCGVCTVQLEGVYAFGGNYWECSGCELVYDYNTYRAEYSDPEAEPCGATCKSHPGNPEAWECTPCPLPSTHQDLYGGWGGHYHEHRRKEAT